MEASPRAADGGRARGCRLSAELPESSEARCRGGRAMTRTVLLAALLAAGPSPSPAPTPTALPTPTPEKRDPHLVRQRLRHPTRGGYAEKPSGLVQRRNDCIVSIPRSAARARGIAKGNWRDRK